MQLEAQVQAQLAAVRLRRKRQARVRMLKRLAAAGLFLLALVWLFGGIVYAGSADTIARGLRVSGVDVAGLSVTGAQRELERRAYALRNVPLRFRLGERVFTVGRPGSGVTPDWPAAVAAARARGDGFGPIRGFKRLYVRVFGTNVVPPAIVGGSRLDHVVARLAAAVDQRHRDAVLRLRGLQAVVIPAKTGTILDRRAARRAIVAAVVSLRRDPMTLITTDDQPTVTAADLEPARAQAATALSTPVRLALGPTRVPVPRLQLARMLELPSRGGQALQLGGPGTDAFFRRLQAAVDRPPRDAGFAVLPGGQVRVIPSEEGRTVDVPRTAQALLAAALSPQRRVARLVVETSPPKRTTAEARAMGITETVGSFETVFGGDPNRISNVQRVAQLLDDALIAPGHEFSFNRTTGARNAAKGFKVAPVIINGELQNALGGGVCQASTTVFNAAYVAGLPITARTNHALYISHYPQGRDATVDYPDIDLRFLNDTGHWLLLRTWVSSSSLTVGLYGTNPHRKVVSTTAPLKVTGPPPVKKIKDPTLFKGQQVVVDPGSPSLQTSVRRKVYSSSGALLYDDTWDSSYRAVAKVVRVGTKPKPQPKPKAPVTQPAPLQAAPH